MKKIRAAAARRLAERWAEMMKEGTEDITKDHLGEAKKAQEEKSRRGGTALAPGAGKSRTQGSVAGTPAPGPSAVDSSQMRPPGNAPITLSGKR